MRAEHPAAARGRRVKSPSRRHRRARIGGTHRVADAGATGVPMRSPGTVTDASTPPSSRTCWHDAAHRTQLIAQLADRASRPTNPQETTMDDDILREINRLAGEEPEQAQTTLGSPQAHLHRRREPELQQDGKTVVRG